MMCAAEISTFAFQRRDVMKAKPIYLSLPGNAEFSKHLDGFSLSHYIQFQTVVISNISFWIRVFPGLKPNKFIGDLFMFTVLWKKLLIALMVCNIFMLGLSPAVNARLITTQESMQLTQRQEQLTKINRILLHDEVQEQMLAFGVDPENIQDRLDVLTDEELMQLASRLPDMPAGGDSVLALIGVVFVVLLILELVGVTNVFAKF